MLYRPEQALAGLQTPPRRGSVVLAQLGQTLDGRIATVAGASKYISGQEALKHLHRLRASVDAVLVGVGTVVADDPQLTTRLVDGPSPRRVVLDPRGRTPGEAQILHDGGEQPLLITAPGIDTPPGAEVLHLAPRPDGGFCPRAVIAALGEMGMRRVLVEGGAETLSRFIDAGAIDLLHVLVAPMILGSGKAGLKMRPVARLDQALRPATEVHLFDDGDVLFTCALRTRLEAAE